ncbi:DUF4912 domain-containing protein [Pseudalkalibacillus decolorationis]|uniref:DUF4912 domain-containing protein n=1 Tax=Pseudalkalibacillus decolorationis TaxID=163879 RepID=UPI0021476089|nr:DUF4912 domain-containing protein [Pseudalkalibacillus decolorationis]
MIDEIVLLKDKGYSVKQIAFEMNTSIGKVQYRLKKYRQLQGGDAVKGGEEFGQAPEIPVLYNNDQLTVLPQSPQCVYAFWEIHTNTQNLVTHHLTTEWCNLMKQLKIYDVSDLIFDGHHAHQNFVISLPEMTNNWFVRDLEPNRTYVIDFGIQTCDGNFLTVLRSLPIETPREKVEGNSRHHTSVLNWQSGSQKNSEWYEHFSTYSYYQSLKS